MATPTVLSKLVVMASEDIIYPTPAVNNFLEKLLDLIKHVPNMVPAATKYDKLAVFTGHPADFDIPNIDVDDLWKEVLNKVLRSALGWGDEENMENLIQ